jgi:hypothetical protein
MRRNKADGVLSIRPFGVKNADYGQKIYQIQSFQSVFLTSKKTY